MAAAPVSPLERQQLESARAARATYWHRVRFELVGREAMRLGATAVLDIGAGAGLLGVWVAAHRPQLEYRFEETSPVLRDHLVARFGAGAESDRDAPVPARTLVAMLDVLEHIDDDAAALARLRDRMEPGGRDRDHRAGDAVGVLVLGRRARPPPPLLPPSAARRPRRPPGSRSGR